LDCVEHLAVSLAGLGVQGLQLAAGRIVDGAGLRQAVGALKLGKGGFGGFVHLVAVTAVEARVAKPLADARDRVDGVEMAKGDGNLLAGVGEDELASRTVRPDKGFEEAVTIGGAFDGFVIED